MIPAATTYRKDIDGLRAVSVVAVILFHLGERLPFNGFVGVDIFFVISGFLITGILYKGMEGARFSVAGFYVRRIKRILPAFYAVLACTLAFGLLVMLPEDIKALGKSAFAGVFSASNIYFWQSRDMDYFARSSDLLPLLHTWSLGIEEQFYLLWPLCMAALHRLAGFKGLLPLSIALAGASFLSAQYMLRLDPSFAYYMLPTRAGELLAGAIPFLVLERTRIGLGRAARESLATAGVALVALAFVLPGLKHAFPGLNALYPCLGAALILWTGAYGPTWVSACLSLRPLVAVGLVSYSLYLWHWPVLAYERYLYAGLAPTAMLASLSLILILSILSYRYIEVPFRKADFGTARTIGLLFLAPALALSAVSLALYRTDGARRWIADTDAYRSALAFRDDYLKPAYLYDYVCQTNDYRDTLFASKRCVVGRADRAPEALLTGDSHAAHFTGALGGLADRNGFAFRNIELGNCPPVFAPEVGYGGDKNRQACAEFRARLKTEIGKYRYIILGGAWVKYFPDAAFLPDFKRTLDYLAQEGKQVLVLAEIPTFESFDRNCDLRNNRYFPIDCMANAKPTSGLERAANAAVAEAVNGRPGMSFLDLRGLICPNGECSPYREGKPLYYDPIHLNIPGSRILGGLLDEGTPGIADLLAAMKKGSPGTRPP